jgi:branched-chain amino acid aminotransferase
MLKPEIINECRGDLFVINGKEKPAEMFDHKILLTGISFYEVLKIKKKTPLFLSDHLERLAESLKVANYSSITPLSVIAENIDRLIDLNTSIDEGNIRLILHYPGNSRNKPDIYAYYIPHSYPSDYEYAYGVSLVLIHSERKNVHSKIINVDARMALNRKIRENKAYEALLVNKDGFITEGSKSNFFMIMEDKVTTAPEKDVLRGITRKHIFHLCRKSGIEIREAKIHYTETGNYESCFITGTSPGVLAVRNIGSKMFKHDHPLLGKISQEYEKLVSDYLEINKRQSGRDNKTN